MKPRIFRSRIATSAVAGLLAVLAARLPFDAATLLLLPGAAIASPILSGGAVAGLQRGEAGVLAYLGTLWIGSFLVWSGLCLWILTALSYAPDERDSRIANTVIGTTSAAVTLVGLFAASFRLPVNELYWGGVADWMQFSSIIAGSVVAGLLLLSFHKMNWYWAALIGPLLSFPLSVFFGNVCAIIS